MSLHSAKALGWFGGRALVAVPVLHLALRDENVGGRDEMDVLIRIPHRRNSGPRQGITMITTRSTGEDALHHTRDVLNTLPALQPRSTFERTKCLWAWCPGFIRGEGFSPRQNGKVVS